MSSIERMNRYGSGYRITLSCGHVITRTKDQVKIQQLFIDKRIGCEECARVNGVEINCEVLRQQ